MIRSLIWIAILVGIAVVYSIWTAIGFFVLLLIIAGFLEWGKESLRIKREARAYTGHWYDHPDPEVSAQLLEWKERAPWPREPLLSGGIAARIYAVLLYGVVIGLLALIAISIVSSAYAQIVPNRGPILILPPEEYDHQYEGDLTIKIVDTLEELFALCGQRLPNMLACSYPSYMDNFKSCQIVMVKDETMRKRGWTSGLLFRHEQGHCNGWPGSHLGQRELTKNTFWVNPAQRVRIPLDRLEKADRARESAAGAPEAPQ